VIPAALTHFVGGAVPKDLSYTNAKLINRQRKRGRQNDIVSKKSPVGFLPNITGGGSSLERVSSKEPETGMKDADTWLSTD